MPAKGASISGRNPATTSKGGVAMADQWIVNRVESTTTHVHGRTLNSAGVHHFIIDGPSRPNEEIVSMEAFLAGISSCATHLFEDFAVEEGIRLDRANVTIEAYRPK